MNGQMQRWTDVLANVVSIGATVLIAALMLRQFGIRWREALRRASAEYQWWVRQQEFELYYQLRALRRGSEYTGGNTGE